VFVAAEAGRVAGTIDAARVVARSNPFCTRAIHQWISQSLRSVSAADLWGATADRSVLCDFRGGGVVVGNSGARHHDCHLPCGLLAFGILGLAAGELWNVWFPISKNLWTSSFVLFTAGFALVCLALCYWILDIKQWRGWATPGLVFGMNAIAAYFFAEIVAHL